MLAVVRNSSLLSLAKRTIVLDQKHYKKKRRYVSPRMLRGLIAPNLKEPIFIIGSPRSGTTFLGSCISVLPEISYHFEPVATKQAARYVYENNWSRERSKRFYKNVYGWLMRIHCDGDLQFSEKTPRNCFLVDFLSEAFPDSKFVHIIRDGRDAALSHSKKPWLQAAQAMSKKCEPGGYRYGPYPRFWVEPERLI